MWNWGHRSLTILGGIGAVSCLTACEPRPMTASEVLEALEAYRDSGRGEAATTEPIEISTEFTIGDAVEAAAEQLAAFWQSQQPCTEVTWAGATVTVDYGGLDDTCTFEGRTYGGVAIVDIASTTPGEVAVVHNWQGLTDGEVIVDGGANVLWSDASSTRQVLTEHTWTDVETGETVDVVGDHTWGLLDDSASIWGGLTLEGTRDWTTDAGLWSVEMSDLELRLQDPVAQAGVVELVSPDSKRLTILHERLDDDTIRLTLDGARRQWVFDINALGVPTEVK